MTVPQRPNYYVAHTPSKRNPHWHRLADHIFGVTERAMEFAEAFDATRTASSWAQYLGLLHDLGKFTDKFQNYLWQCHLADQSLGPRPKPGSAPHKQMGALVALDDMPRQAGMLFALPLHGHHGGMESPGTEGVIIENKILGEPDHRKTSRAEVTALRTLAGSVDSHLTAGLPDLNLLAAMPYAQDPCRMEMFLRLLFSCLTDADCLDTEEHNNPQEAQRRRDNPPPPLVTLRDRLRTRQESDFKEALPSIVNRVRREVYDACQEAAHKFPPGVFDLTVPTGGGKTRSGLVFALEHAVKHGLRRVIYAIPFTSIVDQTAQVFRDIFGDDPGTILEHHSAIEPKSRQGEGKEEEGGQAELWRRLAAQNWDAPLIVTTTVQLFESLFSNRPAACRKLHRLANSVIVLDEVQTLPANLLAPLLDGLKTLTENFGVTVVLCTATQPALRQGVSPFMAGFAHVEPIVQNPQRHFAALRRVRYQVEPDPWEWHQVKDKMQAGGSCLCIVNTRRHARALLDLLDPERNDPQVFHLSTLMCGKHRRRLLDQIRLALPQPTPLLLVSTSLIECGVDLDFPRVLRAMGPLDKIIQAAGRCNREGKRHRDESQVTIFTPVDTGMPGGLYQMAVGQTVNLIKRMTALGEEMNFDDPIGVTDFFARFYNNLQTDVDAKKVQERRTQYDYREVAARVKLIDDDTVSVLAVNYDVQEAHSILAAADAVGGMTRQLWQRAQPLCVSLPRTSVETGKLGVDVQLGGLYVWRGEYDPKTGIPLPEDMAGGPVYTPSQLMA